MLATSGQSTEERDERAVRGGSRHVEGAGGKFDREATGFAQPIEGFAAIAAEIGEAFGLLGVCDGAAEKYGQLLSHTVKPPTPAASR